MDQAPEHVITGAISHIYTSNPKYSVVAVRTYQRPRSNPRRPSDSANIKHVRCKIPTYLPPGTLIQATGTFQTYKGKQLVASSIIPISRGTESYAAHYLSSEWMRGFSPAEARATVEVLGPNAMEQLLDHPAVIHKIGREISRARKQEITEHITSQISYLRRMHKLHDLHIPYDLAERAHNTYGAAAEHIIRQHPHCLLHLNADWKDIQQICQALDLPSHDPKRLDILVLEAFRRASEDGHTCLPINSIEQYAKSLVGSSIPDLQPIIQNLTTRDLLIDIGYDVYAPKHLHDKEAAIAARLLTLSRQAPLPTDNITLPDSLSPDQRQAIITAFSSGISILTGPPGSGKTHTITSIVAAAEQLGLTTTLMATTGKAAKRLQQATGMPARTIHRALGYTGQHYKHHQHNPISAALVIVDESSMIDTPLMLHLLEALPESARLLLAGDADQLPSVGPGNILRDIIDSEAIPTARLTTIHRQTTESTIPSIARELLQGRVAKLHSSEQLQGNVHLDIFDSPGALESKLRIIIERASKLGYEEHDIQALSPTKHGAYGTEALNSTLKHIFRSQASHDYQPLDRIVQTSNAYQRGAMNGDIGIVQEAGATGYQRYLIADFDGLTIRYNEPSFQELQLAYCLTIHRSQGSDWPITIVILHEHQEHMLSRSLLYTAITRTKHHCFILASSNALSITAASATDEERFTLLGWLLSPDE